MPFWSLEGCCEEAIGFRHNTEATGRGHLPETGNTNMKFEITYELDRQINSKCYLECKDIGMAFVQCQNEFPRAKMVRGRAYGTFPSVAETQYDPPPVQRAHKPEPKLPRALKPQERGCEFPFYDEVVSRPT